MLIFLLISASNDLTEEQLHQTLCSYLGPENETYINGWFLDLINIFNISAIGKVMTPEVVRRLESEQLRKFNKRYQEIRNTSLNALHRARANAISNGQRNVEKEGS